MHTSLWSAVGNGIWDGGVDVGGNGWFGMMVVIFVWDGGLGGDFIPSKGIMSE